MAVYFHIVELENGAFACRHGRHEYDTHDTVEQAKAHIRTIAKAHHPASIFLHRRDHPAEHIEDV